MIREIEIITWDFLEPFLHEELRKRYCNYKLMPGFIIQRYHTLLPNRIDNSYVDNSYLVILLTIVNSDNELINLDLRYIIRLDEADYEHLFIRKLQ